MRVVEPKYATRKQKIKKTPRRAYILMALLVISLGIFWVHTDKEEKIANQVLSGDKQDAKSDTNQTVTSDTDDKVEEKKEPSLRIFSDNEFKVFYDNLLLSGLARVENSPEITGNEIADIRIRKLAEERGYRLRSVPTVDLANLEGQRVQPKVVSSWKSLKAAAAREGLKISIVSGYRSVADQRALFNSRLNAAGANAQTVADGDADAIVNKVLITSSIPGYSKHHTGYTIDLLCSGFGFEDFKNSTCNTWLAKDNYKIAKENGFIPSYPPLADIQGPDPEAWEYVWVGTEFLYE